MVSITSGVILWYQGIESRWMSVEHMCNTGVCLWILWKLWRNLFSQNPEMPTFRNHTRVKCLFSFTVSVNRLESYGGTVRLLPANDWLSWYLKMLSFMMYHLNNNHLWCIILTIHSNFQERKVRSQNLCFH